MSRKSQLISVRSLLIVDQSALWYRKTFLGLDLFNLGRVFMVTNGNGIPSWSLIPGITLTLSTRLGFDVRKRSRMLDPRVGSLTTCSSPKSLIISNNWRHKPGLGQPCIVVWFSQSIWERLKSPANQIFWSLLISILDSEFDWLISKTR